MTVILLLILTAIAVTVCTLLWLIVEARSKRLMLSQARGIACDAPGDIGISVLCSGVVDVHQVENLLSVEYARYEVVVVLDAQRYPLEFEELVTRYRIIRVEWTPSDELPVEGVRALGRSRKRCYRRLVLIDRRQDTPGGDLDAAAAVATYDYMLPLCGGQYLLHDAVARLVAELGEHPLGSLSLIRSWVGEPAALLAREAIVSAGGFGCDLLRTIPRQERRMLWEPLLCSPGYRPTPRWLQTMGVLVLLAGIIAAVLSGIWWLTAVLLTVALVWSAAACAVLAVADVAGPCAGRLFAWWRCPCKLRAKNFTIS